MCGFVAVYDASKKASPIEQTLIKKMCDVILHRGPDHFGFFEGEGISLGHRRLSIIDLSDEAHQPMQKGDFVIVYNGEIYNYLEIREELQKRCGVVFKTKSDTEVIIEAYFHFGPECVKKFNGMFAFVVWNKRNRQLFVARDRLGVKPLFFTKYNGKYFFASDIKSIWEVVSPSGRLNSGIIRNFLSQGYISESAASTTGIEKFPPAECWIINENLEKKVRFWDLNDVTKNKGKKFCEVVDEAEVLLKDAVKLRLRSDVPVGCFLSGGVDSSLVSSLAAIELKRSFHTYSIGFDSEDYDESMYAEKVAQRYGTIHHHKRLDSSCLELLPQIVWNYSELFGDASAIPSYFVSQYARENLTVVLTGDGADEAFGGYVDPFAVYLTRYYKRLPSILRKMIGKVISRSNGSHYFLRWLWRFNELSTFNNIEAIYANFRDGCWNDYYHKLFFGHLRASASRDAVDRLLYADICDRLCYDFLVKIDMATMAHSLEARSPFLDYRLIELGYSLQNNVRYHHFTRKAVLKAIAEKYVDRDIIYRKKMGFSIPQADWLRSEKWFPYIAKIIARPSLLNEYISPDIVRQALSEFKSGSEDHSNRIWLLLWFQVWEGLFISKKYLPEQKLNEL